MQELLCEELKEFEKGPQQELDGHNFCSSFERWTAAASFRRTDLFLWPMPQHDDIIMLILQSVSSCTKTLLSLTSQFKLRTFDCSKKQNSDIGLHDP